MPPRPKGHSAVSAISGPHGGQASIRKAYEALGVQHFYASHGSHYTNPHEAQIFAAVAQLLDAIPPAVWLGRRDLEPDVAADQNDSDDEGCGNADNAVKNECNFFAANSTPSSGHRCSCNAGSSPAESPEREPEQAATTAKVTAGDSCVGSGAGGRRLGAAIAVRPGVAGGIFQAVEIPEVTPPVPLRVLDLACGSGEATAAITDWNQRHPLTAEAVAAAAAVAGASLPPHRGSGAGLATAAAAAASVSVASALALKQCKGQQPRHGVQGCGHRRSQKAAAAVPVLLPYELHITACDPYTGTAYEQRTGRAALRWSFEDIADGCLADWDPAEAAVMPPPPPPSSGHQARDARGAVGNPYVAVPPPPAWPSPSRPLQVVCPHFDLVVCSFALHLCDPSRLYGTCTALSLAARWLAVLAPHKRPVLSPDLGWQLVAVRRVERTHLRLYRSLRVPLAAEAEAELSAAESAVMAEAVAGAGHGAAAVAVSEKCQE